MMGKGRSEREDALFVTCNRMNRWGGIEATAEGRSEGSRLKRLDWNPDMHATVRGEVGGDGSGRGVGGRTPGRGCRQTGRVTRGRR